MSALANIWTIITTIARQDDDTTRLSLVDIGLALDGSKFEIKGAGGSEGELWERLQFTATRVDDDNVDIDWTEHGYTAPANDWAASGMVRLYQEPPGVDGAMRISFNSRNIGSITSTGDTGEFGKDNVLNSNRDSFHDLSGGSDHTIVATMSEVALVETVALLDLVCDVDAKIRIRGDGAVSPVDVTFPAISPRYRLSERPKIGYQRITPGGHNLDDMVPHGIFYVPPMMPGTVTIDILDSTGDIQFSELLICSYYTPQAAKNINFDSQIEFSTVGEAIQRGSIMHLEYEGRQANLSFILDFMDAYDRTYIDLLTKSKRTIIADLFPNEFSKRWEVISVGIIASATPLTNARTGGATEILMVSTKLHAGI